MYRRKRQIQMYPSNTIYPNPYNLPVILNGYEDRVMTLQNQSYSQVPFHPFWSGIPMNASGSYPPTNYLPYGQGFVNNGWQGASSGYGPKQNISQMLFDNPLQPTQSEQLPYGGYNQAEPPYQNMNPYPQQAFLPKQTGGFQSVMNSFKSQDGNFDVNKMIDTTGQMMNAVSQVSSMIKGLGGMLKA